MLSRLAQDLFWAGRYIERAESTARLVNATTMLLLDLPRQSEFDWRPLVEILGTDDQFALHYPDAGETHIMRFLITDRAHPSAIASSLAAARENLRATRDRIPREVWEEINSLHLFLADMGAQVDSRMTRSSAMDRVVRSTRLVAGQIESGMSRDAAYDMLMLGMSLERADMTTRIIDVRSSDLLVDDGGDLRPYDTVQWISVLKSLSAFQMYRRHARVRVKGAAVVRFLMTDTQFPRSVRFCLQNMAARLDRLPEPEDCHRRIDGALAVVEDTDLAALTGIRLSEFMDRLQIELNALGDAIYHRYFEA